MTVSLTQVGYNGVLPLTNRDSLAANAAQNTIQCQFRHQFTRDKSN